MSVNYSMNDKKKGKQIQGDAMSEINLKRWFRWPSVKPEQSGLREDKTLINFWGLGTLDLDN